LTVRMHGPLAVALNELWFASVILALIKVRRGHPLFAAADQILFIERPDRPPQSLEHIFHLSGRTLVGRAAAG
jgi:hypothetical protein